MSSDAHTYPQSQTLMATFARTSQKFSFMSTAAEVLLHTYLPYRVWILLGFEMIPSYLELELEWMANSFHKEFLHISLDEKFKLFG